MERVEPYVGTSKSARAPFTEIDSLHHSSASSQPLVFTSGPSCDDVGTVTLGEDAEPTIDIPIAADVAAQLTSQDAVDTEVRDIQVGSTLRGRYVLHRLIGTGGTCRVFLAEDLHRRLLADASGELIALKMLRPEMRQSTHSLQRLRREFLQMQQLTHPGITRIFDLDHDGDVWFTTMELVEAPNALTWMSGEYSNGEALHLILACCEAVAHAHRKGIVHGDLKPGNVLVASHDQVKLIDFGSVATRNEDPEIDAKIEATPQYASPSVLAGNRAEVCDDIFALGCLAYMILARGRHPFERKTSAEAALAQLRAPYIPGIPLRLFEVVARALSWDPAQRQGSVRELQHALLATEQPRTAPRTDTAATAANLATSAQPTVEHPPAENQVPNPASPEATHHEPPKTPGDYSYLSKFRGYVAGPMMDTKLHVEEPSEPRAEPPAPAAPTKHALPTDSPAAVVEAPQLYMAAAPVIPQAKVTQQQQPPSPRARALVNACGVSLVLISAVGAALLSRPRESRHSSVERTVHRFELPVLTVPTPLMDPVPLPSVSIGRNKPERTATRRQHGGEQSTTATVSPVSFASRSVAVSPNQTLVAIGIRRASNDSGPIRVAWSIEGDRSRQLLDTARAGAQLIRFHEGQSTRTLYVPLRKEAGELAADGLRSFRVKLKTVDVAGSEEPEIRVTLLD